MKTDQSSYINELKEVEFSQEKQQNNFVPVEQI